MDTNQKINHFLIEEEDLEFLMTLAVKQLNSNTSHIAEKGILNVITFILNYIKTVGLFTKENRIWSYLLPSQTQGKGIRANQIEK